MRTPFRQGCVLVAQRHWVEANRARLTAFLAAMARIHRWFAEPGNAAEATDILRRALPGTTEADVALGDRRAFGEPRRGAPPLASFVDLNFLPAP